MNLLQRYAYDGDNKYSGLKADNVYKNHISSKCPPSGIPIKTKKVAYNLAQDAKDHYLAFHGMRKDNKLWNLNNAAEWCIAQDMEMRQEQREVHGNTSRIATTDKYTGCLRAHSYNH